MQRLVGGEFDPALASVAANVARRLQQLSRIGAQPSGGWTRLGFSTEERAAHDLFGVWASELGMRVSQDSIGNTYARRSGRDRTLMAGSHLDTVPSGGNFDGAAGVVAAIEAAALLADEPLRHDLTVVCFACEEGARFTAPCIGSRAITGGLGAAELEAIQDGGGMSVFKAARQVGLRPEDIQADVWQPESVAAYLELHIEQGRVLEEADRRIGVVDTIAGSTRFEACLLGRSDHSGATPMSLRHDALAGAADVVVAAEQLAGRTRTAVATVGRLQVVPNVVTVVPGEVRFTVDVRDVDPLRQREVAQEILTTANRVAARRGLAVSARLLHDQSPVVLSFWVRDILASSAADASVAYRVMPSGAGHDAGSVSRVAPAGMLFVPCRDGVSHSPKEWCDAQDIALGAILMARALRRLDGAA